MNGRLIGSIVASTLIHLSFVPWIVVLVVRWAASEWFLVPLLCSLASVVCLSWICLAGFIDLKHSETDRE